MVSRNNGVFRAVRFGGLKKVGAVGAHFVVIGNNVGQPLVKEGHTVLAFNLRQRQPVSVQVEPIVVSAAAGPHFLMFRVQWVGYGWGASPGVDPIGMPVAAIGVEYRFYKDERLGKVLLNFGSLYGN